jgi:hypothetical protein
MPETIVTVATYFDPLVAEKARGLLEGEGIHVTMLGESGGSALGLGSIVPIQLQIAETDAPRAEELLTRFEEEQNKDVPAEPVPPDEEGVEDLEASRGKTEPLLAGAAKVEEGESAEERSRALMMRAWRSAVGGILFVGLWQMLNSGVLVLLSGVLCLYSLFLLYRYEEAEENPPLGLTLRFWGSLAINLLVLWFLGYLYRGLLFWWV